MKRPLTTEAFVLRAKGVHGDTYDYSATVYVRNDQKLAIKCRTHDAFVQTPNNHLNGHGCPSCKKVKISSIKRSTFDKFIERAMEVHGDVYDYSKFDYVNSLTKGIIICHVHGEFEQIPGNHLFGYGCRKCGEIRTAKSKCLDLDEFVKRARLVHGDRYDYSEFVYVDSTTLGKIGCKQHGLFPQTPNHHISGNGCSTCVNFISKPETAWLNSLDVPIRQHRLRVMDRFIEVDGFDPATNTAYQFHGDYWHGNPKVFAPDTMNKVTQSLMSQLYERTLLKDQLIRDAGYDLVVMWEDDYYGRAL